MESKNVSFYHNDFVNFDASTGFDLPKDAWMFDTANELIKYHKIMNNYTK